MRRVRAALLLTLLVLAPTASAAPQPTGATVAGKLTAIGKISAFSRTKITIGGKTCRIAVLVPMVLGYRVGTPAKMTCTKGVLTTLVATRPVKIDTPLVVTAPAQTTPASQPISPFGGTNLYAIITRGVLSISGVGTITAIKGNSVTFGGSVTCEASGGEANLDSVALGDRVSFRCTVALPEGVGGDLAAALQQYRHAGILTAITRRG